MGRFRGDARGEATSLEADEAFERQPSRLDAPPVILLENVRHLLTHDGGRPFRVIRRRLLASRYCVSIAL